MKSAGKARNNGLYRHIRTSKEIIRNLLNDSYKYKRNDFNLVVRPIAAKMEPTGMLLAVLDHNPLYDAKRNKDAAMFNIIEIVRVRLDSPLAAWQKK